MTTLNEQIVKEAKTWIGVNFQHHGASKFGCDCSGLIIGVLNAIGYLRNYKRIKYPKDWNFHGMAKGYFKDELLKFSNIVPLHKAKIGDVLLFQWGNCPSHTAWLMEDDMFLNAQAKVKVHLTPLSSNKHRKRLRYVFRLDEEKLKEFN